MTARLIATIQTKGIPAFAVLFALALLSGCESRHAQPAPASLPSTEAPHAKVSHEPVAAVAPKPETPMPESEVQFCQAVAAASRAFAAASSESNGFKAEAMREAAMREFVGDTTPLRSRAYNWIGKVDVLNFAKSEFFGDDAAQLTVRIPCPTEAAVEVGSPPPVEEGEGSLASVIRSVQPRLYAKLADFDPGDLVYFAGTFNGITEIADYSNMDLESLPRMIDTGVFWLDFTDMSKSPLPTKRRIGRKETRTRRTE